jgi:hypothetical protein
LVTHRLQPLIPDDAAMLFGKLLGRDTVRACALGLAKARSMAIALDCNPLKIVKAAEEISRLSRGHDGSVQSIDIDKHLSLSMRL